MSKARGLADLGNVYDDGALSNRSLTINGAMTVAQRGTQTDQVGGYTACDRWQLAEDGSSVFTTSQDSNVPSGSGFASSLKIDVTGAVASPSASNFALLRTKFEGQNVQHICKGSSDAKELTLSFWVSSPKTGTHIVELFDSDNTRQVSKSYTVAAANTWQYVSIVYPADTTGSFNNDNGGSMQLIFWLMAGSNFSGGTLNTSWAANNNSNRAVGQVNTMDSTSNNFYITGVQLELGDTDTPFEHRSFGDELARCQRYFERIQQIGSRYQVVSSGVVRGSNFYFPIYTKVEKRSSPTVTVNAKFRVLDGSTALANTSIDELFEPYSYGVRGRIAGSGLTSGNGMWVEFDAANSTDGYIYFDAEL